MDGMTCAHSAVSSGLTEGAVGSATFGRGASRFGVRGQAKRDPALARSARDSSSAKRRRRCALPAHSKAAACRLSSGLLCNLDAAKFQVQSSKHQRSSKSQALIRWLGSVDKPARLCKEFFSYESLAWRLWLAGEDGMRGDTRERARLGHGQSAYSPTGCRGASLRWESVSEVQRKTRTTVRGPVWLW